MVKGKRQKGALTAARLVAARASSREYSTRPRQAVSRRAPRAEPSAPGAAGGEIPLRAVGPAYAGPPGSNLTKYRRFHLVKLSKCASRSIRPKNPDLPSFPFLPPGVPIRRRYPFVV